MATRSHAGRTTATRAPRAGATGRDTRPQAHKQAERRRQPWGCCRERVCGAAAFGLGETAAGRAVATRGFRLRRAKPMRGKDVGQHAHQPLLHRSPCRRCVATESQTHSSSSRLRSAGYQLKTMYTDIVPCNLWKRMEFRLYMHPKNNTGKVTLATIWHPSCTEHEDIMWDAFQSSEKGSRVYQGSKNLL